MKGPSRVRGFTLIEVVIALSIVAALLAVMFGGLRVGLAAWRQGDARAETLQHARSLSQLLRRALSGIHPYQTAATGQEASQLVFEGDQDRIAFVTSTPPAPSPIPIAFTAVMFSREVSGLTIRQRPLPNREPFEDVAPTLVDAAVADIRFRYLRREDKTWQNRWDPAQEKALPEAVEVTLTTKEASQRVEDPPIVVILRVATP